MKRLMVAEGVEIKLQRLAFHHPLIRHIVDHQMGEIRLRRYRTERGELRLMNRARNTVSGCRVRHPVKFGFLGALRHGTGLAEMFEAFGHDL